MSTPVSATLRLTKTTLHRSRLQDVSSELFDDPERSFWFVGANWDGADQTERFLTRGNLDKWIRRQVLGSRSAHEAGRSDSDKSIIHEKI